MPNVEVKITQEQIAALWLIVAIIESKLGKKGEIENEQTTKTILV